MRKVPRHLFVPADQQQAAYRDTPLPIGYGQTISQPYMVAYMTQAIHPRKGIKVLEIGTGSGYQAAILAEIVDSVFTIEIVKPLGEKSAALLHSLGYNNVKVSIGDGFAGWPEHGPYDGIIVTAAAEDVPPPLIAQLKEDGLLIIPLGKPGGIQTLVLGYKEKGKFVKKDLMSVRFVPFVRE
jgi:protein-L-isoaspartate(D-aspartate) O-methyltransferase